MMSLVVPGLANDVQLPVETHCTGFDEARVCQWPALPLQIPISAMSATDMRLGRAPASSGP